MKNTKIQWADDTWNGWWGCAHLPLGGCDYCFAEQIARRFRGAKWGHGAPRVRASQSYWEQPIKWNAQAGLAGKRRRVFSASMSDVFDPEAPDQWRADLFDLIDQTSNLDWLLLTKRPQIALKWSERIAAAKNIWIGTSVENQRAADLRIPTIAKVPATIRFLSVEPLLSPIRLGAHLDHIDWVIVGGESGPHFRPMDLDWVRAIRDECVGRGVAFFFKQHAARNPHALGRDLDGREWNEIPSPQ